VFGAQDRIKGSLDQVLELVVESMVELVVELVVQSCCGATYCGIA